ncbi:hypothetical protein KsCSTR_43600 [Candidatus Kuenenia stuttgartiensis]|uniref:Uncharacterized protein n=1 Tax=Kuenenia stuttgartiensis TaxID=174633 RepID=Q1PX26_KUEST|nr:hypothetical protein KsCSTR_43600 [Candidatus Kuenenia stuttgartiensis]CAJ71774.1 unknown protein [Candidatus Kuenenia stuttgartiensis]
MCIIADQAGAVEKFIRTDVIPFTSRSLRSIVAAQLTQCMPEISNLIVCSAILPSYGITCKNFFK